MVLNKSTILIANTDSKYIGNFTPRKEYKIKSFYGYEKSSCIILDNNKQEEHFFTSTVLNFFTVKLTPKTP